MLANAAGAVLEPLAAFGSGAVAKPVSEIMGMSAAAFGDKSAAEPRVGATTQGFQQDVQRALTYEPRTAAGKAVTGALAFPGELLAKGAHKVGEFIAPPKTSGPVRAAIGSGVEEALQQAPQVLGAKGGGKLAEGVPKRQAALDVEKSMNAPKDAARTEFQAAGYKTPPERGIKAALSGLAGKTKAEKILSDANEANATTRLAAEVGAPGGVPLTKEEFGRLKESAGADYDAMTSAAGPTLQPSASFKSAIGASLAKIDAALERNPEANRPLRGPQRLLRAFEKQTDFPTTDTLKDIQKQREWAKADFRTGKTEMGTARLAIANQLENVFEDNLARTGQQGLVDQFRAARQRFAKIYLLERVTNDATGRVDLQKLRSLSDSKAYKGTLTGEFDKAARFAKTFQKAAQRSTGEAAPRLTVFDNMFLLGSMLSGHVKYGAMELAGRLGVPFAAERGMLQNTAPSYQVGPLRRSAPYALPTLGAMLSNPPGGQPPQ